MTFSVFQCGTWSQSCTESYLLDLENKTIKAGAPFSCNEPKAFWDLWKWASTHSTAYRLEAQVNRCFNLAFEMGFRDAWFNLEWADYLIQRRLLNQAQRVLKQVPETDPLYAAVLERRINILVWTNQLVEAQNLLEDISKEVREKVGPTFRMWSDRIDSLANLTFATSLHVDTDNQPLNAYTHTLQVSQCKSSLLNFKVTLSNSLYNHEKELLQTEGYLENVFTLQALKSSLEIGGGISVVHGKSMAPIYHIQFKTALTPKLSHEITYASRVYDFTRGSLGRSLNVLQASDVLSYYAPSGFSFQQVFTFSSLPLYASNQFNTYAWLLSPYLINKKVKARLGGFAGYANSNKVLYDSKLSFEEIISQGSFENIEGHFESWFTPNKMKFIGLVMDIQYNPSNRFMFSSTALGGYGQSQEPYLYLEPTRIGLASYSQSFIPVDVKLNLAYTLRKSSRISLLYQHRRTVFNVANNFLVTWTQAIKR
jgi:hypothetical protein